MVIPHLIFKNKSSSNSTAQGQATNHPTSNNPTLPSLYPVGDEMVMRSDLQPRNRVGEDYEISPDDKQSLQNVSISSEKQLYVAVRRAASHPAARHGCRCKSEMVPSSPTTTHSYQVSLSKRSFSPNPICAIRLVQPRGEVCILLTLDELPPSKSTR